MKRTQRPINTTPMEATQPAEREPAQKVRRKLDAFPDRIDIRDWFYQPRLTPLPDQIVNCDSVPKILDQGNEGACTGFALAAVINYLLKARNIERFVSPRMLYEMARRYDEWPGENYEGSSARGAMKGWVAHGVCAYDSWLPNKRGFHHLTPAIAEEAQGTPGGAYYRVMHRQIRDMHAALAEVGILYVTLMVHRGWDEPGPEKRKIVYVESGNMRERELPIIERQGRAEGGHAVAIVGYTEEGFIVQNSWGEEWGADGFALLPYEDYLLHATDVWVAQLGVPVKLDLWAQGRADKTSGIHRAARAIPLAEIRPYVVDVGNNGELSSSGDYWTTEADVKRLFAETIPRAAAKWSKRRVMLYLHGGLNDEAAVARRILAFRDVFMENEIYPLHIMWETGAMETLTNMIRDLFTNIEERAAGVADWLHKLREGLIEAKDRTFELTTAAAGMALWNEMKENARLSSFHPQQKGSVQVLVKQARTAMKGLSENEKKQWELHVVGHSAGSIFAAYALRHLVGLGISFKTLQFMAPAITVKLFKEILLPYVKSGACPHPTLYILSDAAERDDTVGPYGKSLLYLVSNAFEGTRDTPLLGMERFISDKVEIEDKTHVDPDLNEFFKQTVDGLPSLVVAGKYQNSASRSRSASHDGFDNDPDTLNSILRRILGGAPKREFTERDLQY